MLEAELKAALFRIVAIAALVLPACGMPLCPHGSPAGWALWIDDAHRGDDYADPCRLSLTGDQYSRPYAGSGCISTREADAGCEAACRASAASDTTYQSCSVATEAGRSVILCEGEWHSAQCGGGS